MTDESPQVRPAATNQLRHVRGFTIIEVLIVLAIAGLILLIVFLAVPALQRNSRNTRRRGDVSKLLGLVQEAANNNGRTIPTTVPTTITTDKYAVYDLTGANLDYGVITSGAATLPATVDANTIILRNNLKCNNTGATPFASTSTASPAAISIGSAATNVATASGATYRTVVAIYAVEGTGSNVLVQCTES